MLQAWILPLWFPGRPSQAGILLKFTKKPTPRDPKVRSYLSTKTEGSRAVTGVCLKVLATPDALCSNSESSIYSTSSYTSDAGQACS